MPAKANTESAQMKENNTNNNEETVSNTSQDSPTSLIRKLYGVVIANNTVQSSMKRINKISKPLIVKYQNALVEGRHQVGEIRKLGEGVYTSTTERVKTWCYSITIYNHFVGLWLIKNLPFNQDQTVSYEDFLDSFQALSKDSSEESRRSVEKFHKEASELWSKLRSPSLDDIKDACLLIAARAIGSDYDITIDNFASTVVELFKTLAEKNNDIITEEAFYLLTRKRLNVEVDNEKNLRRATKEFYTFAKRFVSLEFPLTYANQDLFRVLLRFTREKFDSVAEVVLVRFDRILNIALKNFAIEYENKEEPINVLDRFHVITSKLRTIAAHTTNKTKLAITESKTYKVVDSRVNFQQRYDDLAIVSQYAFESLTSAVTPALSNISYAYNKFTKEYVVVMKNVSSEYITKKSESLKQRYAILREATINLKNNVLEIKFDKESLERYRTSLKETFATIYEEVSSLNYDKLKIYGNAAYQKALASFKTQAKAVEAEKKESSEKSESSEKKESSKKNN